MKLNTIAIAILAGIGLMPLVQAQDSEKSEDSSEATAESSSQVIVRTIDAEGVDGQSLADIINQALGDLKLEDLQKAATADGGTHASGQVITVGPDGTTTTTTFGDGGTTKTIVKKSSSSDDHGSASSSVSVSTSTQVIGTDGKVRTLKDGETISGILEEMLKDLQGVDGASVAGPAFIQTNQDSSSLKKEIEAIRKEQAEQRKMLEQILEKLK